MRDLGMNRNVFLLSLARLADATGNGIVLILIPLYVADTPSHLLAWPSTVLVGVLISLYGFVFTIAQALMAAASDRVTRRKPFIISGQVILGISTIGFILASRYTHLLALRAIQGVGLALTVSASLALMARITERGTRGGSMALYDTMRMIGLGAGPPLGGWLKVQFSFDAAFLTGSAFVLLSAILVHIWVTEAHYEAEILAKRSKFKLFDPGVLSPSMLGLGIATTLVAITFLVVTTLENEFLARLDQSAVGFGLALGALTFSRLIFQLPLGRLSDRIGRKPMILVGLLILGPTTALLGWVETALQMSVLMGVLGITTAMIATPAYALAADQSVEGGEGQQMSIVTMGFGAGITLGPLLSGLLATQQFELPFLIGGALSLVGAYVVHRFVIEIARSDAIAEFVPPA